MIIETNRLFLREMRQSDYPTLCKILQDKDVMYAYEGIFNDDEVQEWLDKQISRYKEFGFGLWAVVLSETGEMIGQCGLTMQDYMDNQILEVGYLFQKAFWHRGYATEAVIACRDYAFDKLNAEEVFSIIRDNNVASQNVAKRMGMTIKSSFVKHYRGIDMPHYLFSVKRKETESYYGNLCSLFYDIDKPFPNQEELDFYLSFANKNMNILEPMCGSGRFLVSFIQKGFNIDGFDISKDMIEKCDKKIKQLNIKNNNILQCCGFKEFSSDKKYDFVFIPSGSFSLIINKDEIIENIKILEGFIKNNGKIIIELETTENIENDIVFDHYSDKKVVKKDGIEIAISQKITKLDKTKNVIYSICKYELFENGKYVKEEEESFNIKYYQPIEFENYIKETSLKIENKYINYDKEKYVNKKTEKIIYELSK